jgi:hypothetical protein
LRNPEKEFDLGDRNLKSLPLPEETGSPKENILPEFLNLGLNATRRAEFLNSTLVSDTGRRLPLGNEESKN